MAFLKKVCQSHQLTSEAFEEVGARFPQVPECNMQQPLAKHAVERAFDRARRLDINRVDYPLMALAASEIEPGRFCEYLQLSDAELRRLQARLLKLVLND